MGDIVIKEANKIFGSDILNGGPKRIHTDGRVAVSNYLRHNLKMTLFKIGDILDRKHCSIIHYIKLHDNLYRYDLEYKEKYDRLTLVNRRSKLICNPCIYPLNLN